MLFLVNNWHSHSDCGPLTLKTLENSSNKEIEKVVFKIRIATTILIFIFRINLL